jgi:pectin methylesterase-like acyl-CoA thioesterase
MSDGAADKLHLQNVRLLGNQEVMKLGSSGPGVVARVFVNQSYVEGDAGFIISRATAYFRKSEIKWIGAPRNVTFARITASSVNLNLPYGFVFDDCDFTSDGAGLAASAGVYFGQQFFQSALCSPYGDNKATCAIDVTNTTDSATSIKKITLEAVGKTVILNSRIGGHIRATSPWADWNTLTSASSHRLVQYSSDDFWNKLVDAGKAPATLGYTQKVPVEWFLAEYGNTGAGNGATK